MENPKKLGAIERRFHQGKRKAATKPSSNLNWQYTIAMFMGKKYDKMTKRIKQNVFCIFILWQVWLPTDIPPASKLRVEHLPLFEGFLYGIKYRSTLPATFPEGFWSGCARWQFHRGDRTRTRMFYFTLFNHQSVCDRLEKTVTDCQTL
jgi:hypothetical protein